MEGELFTDSDILGKHLLLAYVFHPSYNMYQVQTKREEAPRALGRQCRCIYIDLPSLVYRCGYFVTSYFYGYGDFQSKRGGGNVSMIFFEDWFRGASYLLSIELRLRFQKKNIAC